MRSALGALALMTASFGLGQMIGPLLGAMLVAPNNDFLPPTIMASSVLALSAVILVPLLRRRLRLPYLGSRKGVLGSPT